MRNLERSFALDRPRALIQMATGSGKIYTAVTFVYRLIKHAKACRVLFMVDRAQKYTHGVGNQDLGLTRMINIIIASPPLAEQHRIVAEVERRLSVVAALEAEVEVAVAHAARLRQAILKRAFEGRLVPQDPNDEPASVLLERIQAERENM